jgi:hypothetical protein
MRSSFPPAVPFSRVMLKHKKMTYYPGKYYNMMGSQKFPGMLGLHCNGRIYGNPYLISFKAGPLHAHTLAPSTLSLLVAPREGFFWNILEL